MIFKERSNSRIAVAGAFFAGIVVGFLIAPIKKGVGNDNKAYSFKDCEFHGKFDEDFFDDDCCCDEDCDCDEECCCDDKCECDCEDKPAEEAQDVSEPV